jgi:ABC-2 type transport system ATP-binding protein
VINPKVLFLDEPTTGLDPRSRIALWNVIKRLVADGTTVLLTTQYLEEADQLSDDIVVIDDGRVIAEGTSDQLKAQIGGHRLEVALVDAGAGASEAARGILARFGDGEPSVTSDGRGLEVAVTDGPLALQHVLAALGDAGIELHDAGMRRPTLDDVFLKLTGHKADKALGAADDDTLDPKEAVKTR